MKNTGNWLQISEVQIKGMLSVTTDSYFFLYKERASQVVLVVKNLPANVGGIRDAGSIPGLGRSSREEHDNPLQYSCLENPMDRGAWQYTVHRVTMSQTQLKQLSTYIENCQIP